jgi:cullin 1
MEVIDLPNGFNRINNEGIIPFINFIEANEREFFKAKEFVTLYDLIFKMCIQRDPYNWSEQLYAKYSESIEKYCRTHTKVILDRIIKSSYQTSLMKEWAQRWINQKLVVTGLSKLFMYLDRFYTPNTENVLELKGKYI